MKEKQDKTTKLGTVPQDRDLDIGAIESAFANGAQRDGTSSSGSVHGHARLATDFTHFERHLHDHEQVGIVSE